MTTGDPQAGGGSVNAATDADAPTTNTRPSRRSKAAPFRDGVFLDGRYKLIKSLGEGGMAAVHLADDLLLRRKVALKQLDTSGPQYAAELELFRKEAAVTHTITHPNVARTYDIGDADGRDYISMEWLDGETLMQRIRREPLTPAELLDHMIPLCKGLRAAHVAGIVHRDLKPANIMMVGGARKVVVMDFGIAGRAGSVQVGSAPDAEMDVSPWGVTSAGRGTPAYMAPEQWRQESGDERTDVYALGVIMYVALTCKSPFPAKTMTELENHHKDTAPPDVRALVPEVPAHIALLIQRCMAKSPDDRPRTMQEVIDALQRGPRRRRWARGVALSGLLALGVLGLVHVGVFSVAKSAFLHEVRPGVERMARLVAKDLDLDALRSFDSKEDMSSPAFKRAVEVVRGFKAESPDIKSIYVLRATDKPNWYVFALDSSPWDEDDNGNGTIEPDEEGSPPGLEYDGAAFPAMVETLRTSSPQSDKRFGSDQWGVSLSGYAPILQRNREPTGMFVGVDVGNRQLDALRNGLDLVLFLGFSLFVLGQAIGSFPTGGGGTVWRDFVGRRKRKLSTGAA